MTVKTTIHINSSKSVSFTYSDKSLKENWIVKKLDRSQLIALMNLLKQGFKDQTWIDPFTPVNEKTSSFVTLQTAVLSVVELAWIYQKKFKRVKGVAVSNRPLLKGTAHFEWSLDRKCDQMLQSLK